MEILDWLSRGEKHGGVHFGGTTNLPLLLTWTINMIHASLPHVDERSKSAFDCYKNYSDIISVAPVMMTRIASNFMNAFIYILNKLNEN